MQQQIDQANVVIDRQANAPTVEEAIYGASNVRIDDDSGHTGALDTSVLSKRKRD